MAHPHPLTVAAARQIHCDKLVELTRVQIREVGERLIVAERRAIVSRDSFEGHRRAESVARNLGEAPPTSILSLTELRADASLAQELLEELREAHAALQGRLRDALRGQEMAAAHVQKTRRETCAALFDQATRDYESAAIELRTRLAHCLALASVATELHGRLSPAMHAFSIPSIDKMRPNDGGQFSNAQSLHDGPMRAAQAELARQFDEYEAMARLPVEAEDPRAEWPKQIKVPA